MTGTPEHQHIGRWIVQETLGSGYFATTYRVCDGEGLVPHDIALKLIPIVSDHGSEAHGARDPGPSARRTEVEHLYGLSHQNLVSVRSAPEEVVVEGRRFMAVGLELCDGTLGDRIGRTRDPDALLRAAVPDVLAGLAHLHRHGSIHRDLHPGNVMVREATWKIGDFGGAVIDYGRGLKSAPPKRFDRIFPPEVLESGQWTSAADVFAVAVLVHRTLTGTDLCTSEQTPVQVVIDADLPRAWRPFVEAAAQPLAGRPSAAELTKLVPAPRPDAPEARSLAAPALPTLSVAAVAAGSLVDGHGEVFVVGADGLLWHSWWWEGTGWSGWHRMESPSVSSVAVGSLGPRHLEVFAVTASGGLVHRWCWLDEDDRPGPATPNRWSNWHVRTDL